MVNKYKHRPEIDAAINSLYAVLKDKPYGSKFSWEQLAEYAGDNIIQNSDGKSTLYYIVSQSGILLMRHDQRFLQTELGYGKRIIHPKEHGTIARRTVGRSVRLYRNAGLILAATNMDELTPQQKQEVILDANRYRTLALFTETLLNSKKLGVVETEDPSKAGFFLDLIKTLSESNNSIDKPKKK
jgi:hypothetical protein